MRDTYAKKHPYCIEERARKAYGETDIYEFAGYLLGDGTMLNFSHEGRQRDRDHRDIGEFFSKADGTEAMLKFMRRGNVRMMCDGCGYRFEYIRPLTSSQLRVIRRAEYETRQFGLEFMIEKDNKDGRAVSCRRDTEYLGWH